MASRTQTSSAFKLKLNTGVNDNGSATYTSKSFKDVNPALTDDMVLTVADKLSGLQTSPLAEVVRIDTAALAAR